MKNNGGPAFAGDGGARVAGKHYGMTLRDYFAAHAPAEPQAWFEPVVPDPPVSPALESDPVWCFSRDGADKAGSWRRDPVYDLDYEDYSVFGDFCQAWRGFWDEHAEWEAKKRKQRFIQWPYAWADAMLAERDKEGAA